MLYLTVDEHLDVLQRLVDLGRRTMDCKSRITYHQAGVEYTSLMMCFFLHNLSASETLLRILSSFGKEWFPVGASYVIVRTMFEIDVNAHYITTSPTDRARQYINFEAIFRKRRMEECKKHRSSKSPQWQEAMRLEWQHYWTPREEVTNKKYDEVVPIFTCANKKGKVTTSKNWAGKTLYQMAVEVDHSEAYDIFYSELSSFVHADVRLANLYLGSDSDGLLWSQRAKECNVANVFRYAAIFMTCFLKLFSEQFNTYTKEDVDRCWLADKDDVIP
jgi:hypothetical protein